MCVNGRELPCKVHKDVHLLAAAVRPSVSSGSVEMGRREYITKLLKK